MEKQQLAILFEGLTFNQQDRIITELGLATDSELQFLDEEELFNFVYNKSIEKNQLDTFKSAIQAKRVK